MRMQATTGGNALPDLLLAARALAAAGAWAEVRRTLSDPSAAAAVAASPALVNLLAEAHMRTGNFRDAQTWLAAALPQLTRAGDRPALRRALNLSGAAHLEMGELDDAERVFGRTLEIGQADGDDLLVARATNNLGMIANIRGQRSEALAMYQLAIPAYQRLGNASGIAESYHNMAITLRDEGRLAAADECEVRAIEFAREASNARMVALARLGRAELSLYRGDAALAGASARMVAREFAALPDPAGEADAHRLSALAALAAGEVDEARTEIETAVGLARGAGAALAEAEALRARAALFAAVGASGDARADGEAAAAIYERIGAAEELAAVRDWLARLSDPGGPA